jgi:predicted RNA binding protein YcfA (HicA-like mRNA interferase family)
MKFTEAQRLIARDGWFLVRVKGSHYHYQHKTKRGTVTIPFHSGDLAPMVVNTILKQAGLK